MSATLTQTVCKRCEKDILSTEMADDLKKFDNICCNCITNDDRKEVMEILVRRIS